MRRLKTMLTGLCLFTCITGWTQVAVRDSVFRSLSFGKKVTVISIGSGALKRHTSMNYNEAGTTKFQRSPYLSISFDHCITTKASNAYLGLGAFVSAALRTEQNSPVSNTSEQKFLEALLALKLSHHATYFVRKHLDICSNYLIGIYTNNYPLNKSDNTAISGTEKASYSAAIGIGITARYYFRKNFGIYADAAFGYKINVLNIGICYKIRKQTT